MKIIAFCAGSLCLAAQAFAVSWDQSDPAAGWKKALPAAVAAPARKAVYLPVVSLAAPAFPPSAADDALATFKALAASDLKSYGFRSQAEVNSATIASALPQYFVGLSDLSAYQKGRDPRAIMRFDTEVLIVSAGGKARALITLSYYAPPSGSMGPAAPGWHLATIEGPSMAQSVDAVVQKFKGLADSDLYLIYIPALGEAEFLGARAARQTSAGQAYSLWNDAGGIGLKAGQSKDVDEVFAALQPKALTELNAPHNGPGGGAPGGPRP